MYAGLCDYAHMHLSLPWYVFVLLGLYHVCFCVDVCSFICLCVSTVSAYESYQCVFL